MQQQCGTSYDMNASIIRMYDTCIILYIRSSTSFVCDGFGRLWVAQNEGARSKRAMHATNVTKMTYETIRVLRQPVYVQTLPVCLLASTAVRLPEERGCSDISFVHACLCIMCAVRG